MTADCVTIARRFGPSGVGVHEVGGPNHGAWVQFIQRFTGNQPGDSWCASFLSLVLDIAYFGKPPLVRTARCENLYQHARIMGWLVDTPQRGDIFFYKSGDAPAHHCGFVTDATIQEIHCPVIGIAGNTSTDGTSDNGDRVAEHCLNVPLDTIRYARLPL